MKRKSLKKDNSGTKTSEKDNSRKEDLNKYISDQEQSEK